MNKFSALYFCVYSLEPIFSSMVRGACIRGFISIKLGGILSPNHSTAQSLQGQRPGRPFSFQFVNIFILIIFICSIWVAGFIRRIATTQWLRRPHFITQQSFVNLRTFLSLSLPKTEKKLRTFLKKVSRLA